MPVLKYFHPITYFSTMPDYIYRKLLESFTLLKSQFTILFTFSAHYSFSELHFKRL